MSDNYFLTSDRIGFRCWSLDDLELALELWGNPAVTRLFHNETLSRDEVAARLHREIQNARVHNVQYWPIFELSNGNHIGCAGLCPYDKETLELGFHLKPEYWGSGFATEAGRTVIQHAFLTGACKAIFAGHHPENVASRNVLLKLGLLGTTARHYEPTGLMHPSYLLYCNEQPYGTRLAEPKDARALAIVHCDSIRQTFADKLDGYVNARNLDYCEQAWERRFANNECTALVLTHGEQIVGFASVAPSQDDDAKECGELDRIYIHPSAWGKGHGNVLVNWCESTLRNQGFGNIKLWVFEVNQRARKFYEKLGYAPDGCCKIAFGARLYRYSKHLPAPLHQSD